MKVRKMLKPLAMLMAACILVLSVGGVTAANKSDREIIVYGNINAQKAQIIADVIGGEDIAVINSPLCAIGHSLGQSLVRKINHRVYASAPRCLEITYRVTHCIRPTCSHIASYVEIGRGRIHCCS